MPFVDFVGREWDFTVSIRFSAAEGMCGFVEAEHSYLYSKSSIIRDASCVFYVLLEVQEML